MLSYTASSVNWQTIFSALVSYLEWKTLAVTLLKTDVWLWSVDNKAGRTKNL